MGPEALEVSLSWPLFGYGRFALKTTAHHFSRFESRSTSVSFRAWAKLNPWNLKERAFRGFFLI